MRGLMEETKTMSLSFCDNCNKVVEDNTHRCECDENDICNFCGEPVEEVSEDDPREDR